jgi:hypothetical protein
MARPAERDSTESGLGVAQVEEAAIAVQPLGDRGHELPEQVVRIGSGVN